MQEHRLDLGVRRPEAQGEDRQLHPHLLRGVCPTSCHSGTDEHNFGNKAVDMMKFFSCFAQLEGYIFGNLTAPRVLLVLEESRCCFLHNLIIHPY